MATRYWMRDVSEKSKRHGRKGALHRALHIPEGERIPASRLSEAKHSRNSKIRKMANMAERYKHARHGSKGRS